MGDSSDEFEPVGQYYNVVSPDESYTSANLLNDARFQNIFECLPVESLEELFSSDRTSPPEAAPPVPDGWAQRVQAALLDTESSEEHMNGIFQNALKEADGLQGLNVEVKYKTKQPAKKRREWSLSGKRSSTKPNEEVIPLFTVKERQIRDLFSDCYGDDSYTHLERLNGLPVSLTGRPDFAAWGADRMLMTCEGKHKDNFKLNHAIRQCSAHMLVHLFYWLVTKSRLVQSVYGVAVAGTNCKDMRDGAKFAVVLLRLSLPKEIGGELLLQQYKITNEVGSLEDLWRFVNFVCKTEPLKSPALGYGQGCPALLQMPFELLEDSLVAAPETIGWHMIKNGTANLILRFDTREGYNFIKQYSRDKLQKWENELGEIDYPMFFKSKNYLATNNPRNLDFYLICSGRKEPVLIDIQDAYKVRPLLTGRGLYILMSNMGEPFHKCNSFRDIRNLATKFHPFMKRVLECQEASDLVHGDIHTGNLVYDGEMLHLFDYDEACGGTR